MNKNKEVQIINKEELPFCECGCGERVKKPGNRFIVGHNTKTPKCPEYIGELPFCECGCGKRIKKKGNRFLLGHNSKGAGNNMRGKTHTEKARLKMSALLKTRLPITEKTRQKMSIAAKNKPPVTEETRQKMSKSTSGKNNPMYGKKGTNLGKTFSIEHKQKISEATSGKNNPMYGKKHTKETCKKIRDNHAHVSGKDHHNWQGGNSCEPYCPIWTDKEFKQDIRDRDNNIAWDIGYWYKGTLCINHINFDKKDCAPQNLITVSIGMNTAVNFHREFYTEWFQIAMNHRLGYEYGI